jgi:hypothetical protein
MIHDFLDRQGQNGSLVNPIESANFVYGFVELAGSMRMFWHKQPATHYKDL